MAKDGSRQMNLLINAAIIVLAPGGLFYGGYLLYKKLKKKKT